MGSRVRVDPVAAHLAGVDRTLIEKNLMFSAEDRFLQLFALQRLADELEKDRLKRAAH